MGGLLQTFTDFCGLTLAVNFFRKELNKNWIKEERNWFQQNYALKTFADYGLVQTFSDFYGLSRTFTDFEKNFLKAWRENQRAPTRGAKNAGFQADLETFSFQSIFISWDEKTVSNSSTFHTPIR